MLTTRKPSLILLASALVIFSTPILNYQAQGWAKTSTLRLLYIRAYGDVENTAAL